MSNPQGPGKQGRKAKAPQQHHAAARAPGRSEQHQAGHSARPHGEQGHMPQRSSHSSQSHSSQSHSSQMEDE